MPPSTDLTTEIALQAYLQSLDPPMNPLPTTITLLTGGTANYVYRATFPSRPSANSTKIYKHAAPYLHSNTAFAFDPIRLHYEAWAYATLPLILGDNLAGGISCPRVATPTFYWHRKEANLLCIADGGTRNLKDAYASLTREEVRHIGGQLGEWLAMLHSSTKETSMNNLDASDLKKNNPVAKIYCHSYRNLASALQEFGCEDQDIDLAAHVHAEFGRILEDEIDGVVTTECVCHGDFWPGNVLLSNPEGRSPSEWRMTIVDWEMVRRGGSATDVGQFAAEAFLLDRFRGSKGLLPAFLTSYVRARRRRVDGGCETLKGDWMRRMAVHGAVHVAFWPTKVEWTDREGTRELVRIGVDMIRKAFRRDWEGMKGCELPFFVETCLQ